MRIIYMGIKLLCCYNAVIIYYILLLILLSTYICHISHKYYQSIQIIVYYTMVANTAFKMPYNTI